MTKEHIITANFERIIYSLTVLSGIGGNASEGEYYYGYNASLSALTNEGYSFSKWEGTGVENPFIPFTRIRITEDRNVTATFEIEHTN